MNDLLAWFLALVGFVALLFFTFQFLTNGFFLKFLRVKASRGKKLMVNSRERIGHDFYVANIAAGWIFFKDRENKIEKAKEPKRIVLPANAVYRAMGIWWVNFDSEKNAIVMPDMRGVSGFDAIKWNSLLKRAMKEPKSDKKESILLLICVIGFLILIVLGMVLLNKVNAIYALLLAAKTIPSGAQVVAGVA